MARRGAYGLPYRPPADGWFTPPLTYLGGLYQHQRSALQNITALQNTTQVQLQPNQIGAPVTRYTSDMEGGGAGDCEEHGTPGGGSPWLSPNFPPALAVNTFAANGTVNYGGNCRLRGGKWVQAVRQWQGTFGFLSHDLAPYNDVTCAAGSAGYPGYESPQLTADQTKYRTCAVSATVTGGLNIVEKGYLTADGGGDGGLVYMTTTTYSGGLDYAQTISVGANSGLLTMSGYVGTDTTQCLTEGVVYMSEIGTGPVGTGPSTYDYGYATGGLPYNPGAFWSTWSCSGDNGGTINAMGFSGNAAQFAAAVTAGLNGVDHADQGWTGALTSFTLSNTELQVVITLSGASETTLGLTGDGGVLYNRYVVGTGAMVFTLTVSLTDANSAGSVYADVVSLLGTWNLADDGQYPPRTDGLWQIAPLVSRDESGGVSPLIGWQPGTLDDLRYPIADKSGNAPFSANWTPTYSQMGWRDMNAWGFSYDPNQGPDTEAATGLVQFAKTGVVLGAPSTTGTQNYFDFRATIWKACYNSSAGAEDWYIYGYGQWLTDAMALTGAQLPLTATQWTNNFDASTKPPYAYLIQGGALWAQKCCEYMELWPSYDFFRPAGPDKFAYDETTVCCVGDLTAQAPGGTFTSQDYEGSSVTLTPASGSIWGGSSVGGFYNISVSGSTVTLGTLKYKLPSDWVSRSGDDNFCFGELRFTSNSGSVPSIQGRAAVTVGGTFFTFALAQTAFGLSSAGTEQVDLYDASMSVISSNVTATRVSDTQFTTATAYPGTAWVMIHGAPDWCWDDNGRKGDFVGLTWLFDNRTNGESGRLGTTTLDCGGSPVTVAANNGYAGFSQTGYSIAFKPCCASAVFITPNGETTSNSVTLGFPGGLTFDDRYGARWQAELEQSMVPSWWQAPHRPCGSSLDWAMDDGTCQPNDDPQYYAHFPLVEARISVPTNGGYSGTENAPTPVEGIGYVSPVSSGSGLGAPGAIGFDTASGNPSAAWTFWGYRLNIESTCGGCRFNYADQENLPCVDSYVYTPAAAAADIGTNSGSAGSGGTT